MAAAPANDDSSGAIPLTLPDTVTADTTQATVGAEDAQLNTFCGAPATNGSVWYSYTPSTTGDVLLDVTASNFSAGLMVSDGPIAADGSSLDTCGPGEVGLHAVVGHTYLIMAFSDDPDVVGGNLSLSISKAPPPTAHVRVAKRGKAFHGGAAELHGSYRCTHDESFAELDAHLLQRAGRLKIQADGGTGVQCDGKKHHWSARLVSPVGTYAKGTAKAKVALFVCGLVRCAVAKDKAKVKLSWASGTHRSPIMHRIKQHPAMPGIMTRPPGSHQKHLYSMHR
jgi:hypothetical protein